MSSWRGDAGGLLAFGSDILLLLGDGRIARRASPHPAPRQQVIQLPERHHGCPRRAELHAFAGRGIQHPRRESHDYAGRSLDVNDPHTLAVLDVVTAQATTVQGMPAIVHHDLLPDMGRMSG
jgi:hypothetical protein